jgi:hypothetical protein
MEWNGVGGVNRRSVFCFGNILFLDVNRVRRSIDRFLRFHFCVHMHSFGHSEQAHDTIPTLQ